MKNPFCFRIAISRKRRIIRRVLYIFCTAALLAALTWGLLTVYVNSHNIVYSEQITVTEILDGLLHP